MKKIQSYFMLFIFFAALLPAAIDPMPVAAQGDMTDVDIQPDGDSGYDTFILSTATSTNYGSDTSIMVGDDGDDVARGLIFWDFSGLPYDADVQSATLSLWVSEDLADNASTLQVYVVKRQWSELYATYTDYYDETEWGTAGATGTDDIEADPIGEVALTSSLAAGTRVDITILPEYIGHMIRENYFGILLKTELENEDAYKFHSSDSTSADYRPMLSVTYDPTPTIVDPGWFCVDGSKTCLPGIDPAAIVSPFQHNQDDWTSATVNYGPPAESYSPVVNAKINCEPYPLCKNDYPIYYRVEYVYSWYAWSPGISSSMATTSFVMMGTGTVATEGIPCGNGLNNYCYGQYMGVLQPEEISTSGIDSFDFSLKMNLSVPAEYPTTASIKWRWYLSREPFESDCADNYAVPVIDTYEIDPTIEDPVGMVGGETPIDNQGYPLTVGAIYMLRFQGGPWNDGTTDRYDTAIKFSSESGFLPTAQNTAGNVTPPQDISMGKTLDALGVEFTNILCVKFDPLNPDLVTIYFEAEQNSVFVRVNDTAGNFANNTNDAETPISYSIGLAFPVSPDTSCEAQFDYDPVSDLVVQSTVGATEEDVAVDHSFVAPNTGLTPGAWYGISLSGVWLDAGVVRTDLDFKFTGNGTTGFGIFTGTASDITDWADLAEGSPLVYCVSSEGTTIFFQAPDQDGVTMHLRVNDQDVPVNFSDNSGTVTAKIYAVTFTQQISGCELQFEIGDLVASDTVEGDATNGGAFANMLAMQGSTLTSYDLVAGGWYVLETTGGPWRAGSSSVFYDSGKPYYDVQLRTSTGSISNPGEWEAPADWGLTTCAKTIDALGHVRVYFQAPNPGAEGSIHYQSAELFLRAAGAGILTGGSIGWELYEVIDLSPPGGTIDNCNDYSLDLENPSSIGEIDARHENGDSIVGLELGYQAIRIESDNTAADAPFFADSGWFENVSAAESDSLQLSIDGGETWDTLPAHPAVLCYYNTYEGEMVFIFQVLNGQSWKMRAESESFGDNFGKEIYSIYTVTAGDSLDPWTSCSDDYTASVPAINEFEWIPPQDEEGINLMPTLTYTPENDPNNDGVIIWGDPGLEAGHDYMVETMEGPWEDGEAPTDHYDAQLSSDGGATWYAFGDHPNVICADEDQIGWYWKAIFHAEIGQVWKIRVADTDSEVFTDNTGNLAYKLNLVNEFPVDGPGALATDYNPSAFDACSQLLVRPEALSLSEIGSVGNYLADWIQYINRSLISFAAWCPRHTDMIMSAINALKTREPIAMLEEMDTVQKTVVKDIDSYDWDGGYEDTSIFNLSGSDGSRTLFERIMPTHGDAFDVWDGGNLINLESNTGLPSYYYTCNNVFAEYIPSRLRMGVCFASAYWKETGASFWVQLLLDIGSIFLLFAMLKGSAQSLIYMMTGVRPWTKDGAIKIVTEVASGQNVVQSPDNWRRSNRV